MIRNKIYSALNPLIKRSTACAYFLLLLIAFIGSQQAFKIYQNMTITEEEINLPLTMATPGEEILFPPHPDLSSVIQKKLFGQHNDAKNNQAEKENSRFRLQETLPDDDVLMEAPKSKSRARLVGVMSSRDPAIALAIVEQNGQQSSYSIGERLPGENAEIIRVFSDRVIINERGHYAALMME